MTVNDAPEVVGVTLVGFSVHVEGFVPVQLSATELLYPFSAVSVPLYVALCVGKMVCV